jgi:hypothetical protein
MKPVQRNTAPCMARSERLSWSSLSVLAACPYMQKERPVGAPLQIIHCAGATLGWSADAESGGGCRSSVDHFLKET